LPRRNAFAWRLPSTAEGQKTFHDNGLHAGICTTLVRSAIEILEEEMEGKQCNP
jgi:hypothetical protein